ncbi:glycosyltransferase [Prevotella sp. P6B1]|uniref:glycosyltransferase family 2 protein n=1 Tax=Prevotella sp. P6B1 TaxID=1410613 RepID=UPI0009DEBF08|nr:glycosyltransferase [Prevotella sp. P6B1]
MDIINISIIIPVYGVSAYIGRCIRSVMNQTYSNIECIIVDDATPDDSIEKCERLIADYQGPIRFSVLHHEKNRGLSAARNTGLQAATGDYLFFFDSDDELTADCIEKLVRPVLKDTSIEMVMGGYVRCTEGSPTPPNLSPCKKGTDIELSSLEAVRDYWFRKKGINVYMWNKLIKKDFLHQNQLYFKEGLLYEDILWFFYAVKYLRHFYAIPDMTYIYYRRPRSITTGLDKAEKARHFSVIYEEIANHFTENDSRREAKCYTRSICYHYINNPKIPSFAQSTKKFKKEFSARKDLNGILLLTATRTLLRYRVGESFLHSLISLYLKVNRTKRNLKYNGKKKNISLSGAYVG